MENEIIFSLKNACKIFESRSNPLFGNLVKVVALNNISLSIEKGETLAIVGESGCGKSSLARLLLGMIEETSGCVLYKGQKLKEVLASSSAQAFRKDVQMVFQDPASTLNPRLSIGSILSEVMLLHKIANKQTVENEIENIMQLVELPVKSHLRYAHEFSGGQRQRIGIARALATAPKTLILDEAVSALDISVQGQILNLLLKLKEEMELTYLFISHDLSVVKFMSNRVLVMYLGQIMEEGKTENIFSNAKHPYTKLLLNSAFSVASSSLKNINGEEDISFDKSSSQCPFAHRCSKRNNKCLNSEIPKVEVDDGYVYCVNV